MIICGKCIKTNGMNTIQDVYKGGKKMRKIKVIQINDNIRSQLLVGNTYLVKSITEC